MDWAITIKVFLGTFALAAVLGAVVQRTSFCTMGGVSDWVNIGDTGRMRAWIFAMAVAVLGALALEFFALVDLDESRVPYRSPVFMWPRYILGGIAFGVGMTLASGCGAKNLVRLGAGNLKSFVVVVLIALCAYAMTRTDFYGVAFHSWMLPISPDLRTFGLDDQSLPTLLEAAVGAEDSVTVHLAVGIVLGLALLAAAFSSRDFRAHREHVFGGLVVGLCVLGAWYLTGGTLGQEWIEAADFADQPPAGVGVQSMTFVAPTADLLVYLSAPKEFGFVTFGVVTVAGMIAGSAVAALLSRSFRFEWFTSFSDVLRHVFGAVLMGIGGVLALGCTIGQGVTGLSTLAVGSFIAVLSIILSSALTMKVQYYQMLYEDASFGAVLVTALADLRLLPNSMRRLEAL